MCHGTMISVLVMVRSNCVRGSELNTKSNSHVQHPVACKHMQGRDDGAKVFSEGIGEMDAVQAAEDVGGDFNGEWTRWGCHQPRKEHADREEQLRERQLGQWARIDCVVPTGSGKSAADELDRRGVLKGKRGKRSASGRCEPSPSSREKADLGLRMCGKSESQSITKWRGRSSLRVRDEPARRVEAAENPMYPNPTIGLLFANRNLHNSIP
ncbi:hypothetical protein C8R45DRAFT_942528 [Mycena sanguinolenta]|nr:hypothetical protein C8R45DRAFT_942528 [Mycena sanguinolenta]